MKVCGIVCEYNPFHNGHLYQINKLKTEYGFDAIVGIMSGNWVQRGDAAIFDKYVRAKAAIMNGMDLVIELPAIHAMQSAEIFAYNAVYILNSLGVIDYIAFGAETDKIEILERIAKLLVNEPESFKNIIRSEINKGIPYFAARSNAIGRIFNNDFKAAASLPNNILGIEYIKALIRQNSKIKPIALKRCGVEHDAMSVSDDTASATCIRNLLFNNKPIARFVPDSCKKLYKTAKNHSISQLDNAIISHFIKSTAANIKNTPDIAEGLENKIIKAAQNSKTVSELYDAVKSKRYAHSRIRRIVLNSFLEITKDDAKMPPVYVKVLNFTQAGQKVLHNTKNTCSLPIGTNRNAVKCNTLANEIWDRELMFDRIYDLTEEI